MIMEENILLDSLDRAILRALQHDASRSIQQIADAVGLSQNPCWRRIRRLESDGVIRGRVALVDPRKVDKRLTVFVSVRTNQHNQAWFDGFAASVRAIPEVVEFYRMSGGVDYLLKILAADVAEYDAIYKRLIESAELYDVSSSFAMEQIKFTTEVPIGDNAV
jgi:Lrp/AsnC family transcriptional regulator